MNKVWFSSSKFQNPESATKQYTFILKDRAIFSSDFNGENWQSFSIKDGLPKAEISAMSTYKNQLLLGSSEDMELHGLMIMDEDGKFDVYGWNSTCRPDCGITEILSVFPNEIWVGTREGLRILRVP